MKYYKFVADTPYCGTDYTEYYSFEDEVSETILGKMAEEIRQQNAETYEYLVFGWLVDPVEDGDISEDEYEETIDNYYSDCTCEWEEISEEEFLENT